MRLNTLKKNIINILWRIKFMMIKQNVKIDIFFIKKIFIDIVSRLKKRLFNVSE